MSKSLLQCSAEMAPGESPRRHFTETLHLARCCQRTFNALRRHVSSLYMQNTPLAEGPSVQCCLRCAREFDELDPHPQCPLLRWPPGAPAHDAGGARNSARQPFSDIRVALRRLALR